MDRAVEWISGNAGTLVALLATLIGLSTSIGQMTLGSRLRRVEAWARTARESEDDGTRVEAIRRIERLAVARSVALSHVPAYWFIFLGLPPFLFWMSAFFTVVKNPSWFSATLVVASYGAGSLMFVRQAIRVYLERARIARAYFNGADVSPARLGTLDRMEGGTRREFTLATAISFEMSFIALGIALMVGVGKFLFWPAALAFISFLALRSPYEELRRASVTSVLRDNDASLWADRREQGKPIVGE